MYMGYEIENIVFCGGPAIALYIRLGFFDRISKIAVFHLII